MAELGLQLLQGRLRLPQRPLRPLARRVLGAEGGLGYGDPVDRRRTVRAAFSEGIQNDNGNLAILGEAVGPTVLFAPRREPIARLIAKPAQSLPHAIFVVSRRVGGWIKWIQAV
jgi:hypothetical protein